ncbi:MAG: hypothetical protein J5486_08080 [Bacteroidaceae bacterium]|nr:hypothetical protein [Bacteroidaceae bacterium]
MKKILFTIVMAVTFTACADRDDNSVSPDTSQQSEELADYTIIYYGHGGGNLDMLLIQNIMDFSFAEEEAYKNVNICVQYKFSTLKGMEDLYEDLAEQIDPNDPEMVRDLEAFKTYYPFASKTMRFVVNRMEGTVSDEEIDDDEDEAPTMVNMDSFYGKDNADIANPDSLTNFINWAAKVKPAKKYILVLSDHGGGYCPDDDIPQVTAQSRGVIYDDGNDTHFNVKSLAQAISAAKVRPAAVYLDACLMNSAEYLFELAPLTDYYVGSTFLVPGLGGDYISLINALSQNPNDLEKALSTFAKATVDGWEQGTAEGELEDDDDDAFKKIYRSVLKKDLDDGDEDEEHELFDMSVIRTAELDAVGTGLRTFTDKLVDAYQSGDEQVKLKIDYCTENTYKVCEDLPYYDLIYYMESLCLTIPDVFNQSFVSSFAAAYDKIIVYQQSCQWLEENETAVDLSVLLGCNGHYSVFDYMGKAVFYSDGKLEYLITGMDPVIATWDSTLDATYGQLRFEQLTGWSRWLKVNQQEPNEECFTGFLSSIFEIDLE